MYVVPGSRFQTPTTDTRMDTSVLAFVKGLPLLAVAVAASASYPAIPSDLTTPVQQRLAIQNPTCMFILVLAASTPIRC